MIKKVEVKWRNMPDKPGIYMYKNKDGEIIYVGKSKSLKKRVASYFLKFSSEKKSSSVKKKTATTEAETTSTKNKATTTGAKTTSTKRKATSDINQDSNAGMSKDDLLPKTAIDWEGYNKRKAEMTREDILYGEKLKKIVDETVDLDFIITSNEKEALILENDMIKKYQPKYNVLLKDDKSYPWVLITYSEEFPRISVIRRPQHLENYDKKNIFQTQNKYIGPFIDVGGLKRTLKYVRKYIPYCTCKKRIKPKSRPCLNYQIKLCPAPCAGKITSEDYLENIKQIERILEGDVQNLIAELTQKMDKASGNMEYEKAAKYRDLISGLKSLTVKQSMVNYDEHEKINRDVLGYYTDGKALSITLMHIRDGRLVGKTPFIINTTAKLGDKYDLINSFLEQYYLNPSHSIPDDIIIPSELDIAHDKISDQYASAENVGRDGGKKDVDGKQPDEVTDKAQVEEVIGKAQKDEVTNKAQAEEVIGKEQTQPIDNNEQDAGINIRALQELLKERTERTISIRNSYIGPFSKSILKIGINNAKTLLELERKYKKVALSAQKLKKMGLSKENIKDIKKEEIPVVAGLYEIKKIAELDVVPAHIEGFDISNWQNEDATGAMVCFRDGKPYKKEYRSFIIRDKSEKGDFSMMQEVIHRRYKRLLSEGKELPDLIIVDGGKPQVSAACKVLEELQIPFLKVIGLEKGKIHSTIDYAVIYDRETDKFKHKELKRFTEGYNLLQFISDEYHRRAISHHRKLKKKSLFKSELDGIKGIGVKTREKLFDKFKTMDKILAASKSSLQELFGEKRGENIFKSIQDFKQSYYSVP